MDDKQIARFWSRVEKRGPDECWEWTGAKNARGYGVGWNGKQTRLAHRIAWFATNGSWPDDCLCHKCDNPPCCNPAHLWEGDRSANLADMRAKGRGCLPPRPSTSGESHAVAKLSEREAAAILRRGSSGEPAAALAREFKVSAANVYSILSGNSWPHLERPPVRVRARAIITPPLVTAALAANDGETRAVTARRLGISVSTLYAILRGHQSAG